jgi:hypothetical protein
MPDLVGAMTTLAQHSPFSYRPFLDPVGLGEWWWLLLVPLSLGVSIVYKAVRVPTMDRYWRDVIVMTVQIIVSMILLAFASFMLVEIYAKFIGQQAM